LNIPAGGYNSLTLKNIGPLMNELTSVDHKNITATFHQLLSVKIIFLWMLPKQLNRLNYMDVGNVKKSTTT
jgi:hypothetical protein